MKQFTAQIPFHRLNASILLAMSAIARKQIWRTLKIEKIMLLEFRDNKTLHDDLILHFDGQEIVCDSYYFALDRNIEPDIEDSEKIKIVLKSLLEQWLQYVSKAKSGDIINLPYDFSDEYTGCLKCEIQKENVELFIGYLDYKDWNLFPSDISKFVKSMYYFVKSKDAIETLTKSDFIKEIKHNIKYISK